MGILAKNKELFLSTSGDVVRGWKRDYGRLANASRNNNSTVLFLGLVTFRISDSVAILNAVQNVRTAQWKWIQPEST